MFTIAGLVFLLLCVFGSFVASGGAIGPLVASMPFELLSILGAAIGTFLMANSLHDIKHTIGGFKKVLKGPAFKKADYVEMLSLLYFFVKLASSKGATAIEPHIEKPDSSSAFAAFPKVLANHHAGAMICDYLRMVGMTVDDPHQLDDIMARELKKRLAYGVVAPIAARLSAVVMEESKYYELIRAVLVAHLHGNPPQISIESGRKMVPNEHMPSFGELETAVQSMQIA